MDRVKPEFFRMFPGNTCQGTYIRTERRSTAGKRKNFILISTTSTCIATNRAGDTRYVPPGTVVYLHLTVTLRSVIRKIRKDARKSTIELQVSVKDDYVLSSGKILKNLDVLTRAAVST